MKIYYYTFGCKVNQYETENIRERFEENGCLTTCEMPQADVCVINTCTVTEQADSKCMQLLRRVRKAAPRAVVVLAGCFPQAFTAKAEALAECDIIVGTEGKGSIPQLVDRFMTTGERIVSVAQHTRGESFDLMTNKGNSAKTRAYIKIQDGCDCYCTYCIIPYARGHLRSKPLDVIVEEAQADILAGHKEIILTGINLCFYGKDLPDRPTLTDAVEKVCSLEGEFRVRLGSIEPEMMLPEDIERISKLEKLCPHFHLSLQSGSSSTLKLMNRRYTPGEYAKLCDDLRSFFPNCAITTDIMVGFPQEDEAAFAESLAFAEKIAFAEAHIFPYSRRAGTKADTFAGQVDQHTKHLRAAKMAEVCAATKKAYLSSCVGRTFPVLFEKETEPQWHCGHAPNYVTVKVPRLSSEATLRREIKNVLITSADENFCFGKII
ncbi:tRNA (N(6)-L-threonylcarbamoyladenosine(37)-C(2))-methylthiotransferase MtaB [Ruminococcus sp.]|uniref:tRNA (N(6)-L-threonylcarbamoyladenosine(37)-C(2))- methylthiotransferase MtaB n=1 Tax=Ruminococcus sp. TaxID=41978 RepID=UPI0025E2F325|nr:tRNA (N(6)-L-threonylcarbamoyladenosine(37)-C(2))-methylthiotransferase MtaB [Ruminococcus sp.]MBQ8967959.1 tRNA (N(6)-L-threonylcarbamoyladenosine(37)-C(2))-methylthiotransferase MtaB [Ruminococcus sp.]